MHVKNADLHVSYSAPVRVSETDIVSSFVTRAVTFLFAVLATVARELFGVTAREEFAAFRTVVRGVIDRSDFIVVETRFCVDVPPRDAEFPSRTAALTTPTPIAIAMIKTRIFFISDEMLAKFQNSEQAKYDGF